MSCFFLPSSSHANTTYCVSGNCWSSGVKGRWSWRWRGSRRAGGIADCWLVSWRWIELVVVSYSANQTGPLGVKLPAGNQELHRGSIVAGAETHLVVESVGLFNLNQIRLQAEAGQIGDRDRTADDLEGLAGQPLAILPDPMSVNGGNPSRCGGGDMREHCERDVEVIVGMRTPRQAAPVAAELGDTNGALHGPEM